MASPYQWMPSLPRLVVELLGSYLAVLDTIVPSQVVGPVAWYVPTIDCYRTNPA